MRNKQRREETLQAILQAATSLFAEKGYDATGVAEICRQAGVSKGAFYYHFETKQAVFLATITRWLEELEVSLGDMEAIEGSAPERLLTMSHAFQATLESQNERRALILEFWIQASRDETVRQAVLSPYRTFQRLFEGIIQEGVASGEFRPIGQTVGAQVLLSMASGLFFQGLLDPEGSDWGVAAEHSIQVLLEGLKGG
jgi:AcrR family transcriptional regulator